MMQETSQTTYDVTSPDNEVPLQSILEKVKNSIFSSATAIHAVLTFLLLFIVFAVSLSVGLSDQSGDENEVDVLDSDPASISSMSILEIDVKCLPNTNNPNIPIICTNSDTCPENYHPAGATDVKSTSSSINSLPSVFHCHPNCPDGYHNENTLQGFCKPNICTCQNGSPKQNENCKYNNSENCQSCQVGYTLRYNYNLNDVEPFQECHKVELTPNKPRSPCRCQNGIAKTDCTSPDQPACLSCDENYHLNSSSLECEPNVCICSNGQAVDSNLCLQNGENNCQSCDEYYHLEDKMVNATEIGNGKTCQHDTCFCENGVPSTDLDCLPTKTNPTPKTKCISCHPGYHLKETRGKTICQANTCSCLEGSDKDHVSWSTNSTAQQICTQHNGIGCIKCDKEFYHLMPAEELDGGNYCRKNKCPCANGVVMDPCPSAGLRRIFFFSFCSFGSGILIEIFSLIIV